MALDFDKQFKLYADASDIGLGAVLLQEDVDGQDHPICYFQGSLTAINVIIVQVRKRP